MLHNLNCITLSMYSNVPTTHHASRKKMMHISRRLEESDWQPKFYKSKVRCCVQPWNKYLLTIIDCVRTYKAKPIVSILEPKHLVQEHRPWSGYIVANWTSFSLVICLKMLLLSAARMFRGSFGVLFYLDEIWTRYRLDEKVRRIYVLEN